MFWSIKYPDHSVGFACGGASQIWALDIDADRAEDASRIEQITDHFIGSTPLVRIGKKPRSLRVYRSLEPVKSTKGELLDVLGAGRQFVGLGTHQKTGQPYQWLDESPLNYEASALPTTTNEALTALLSALKEEFGTAHHLTGKSSQQGSVLSYDINHLQTARKGKSSAQRFKVLATQLREAVPGELHTRMVSVVASLHRLKMRRNNIHQFFNHHFAAPRTGEYAEVWEQIDQAITGAEKNYGPQRH